MSERRFVGALLTLVLSALACNLTVADSQSRGLSASPTPAFSAEGDPPIVSILAPSNDQQVQVGRDVEIVVQASDAQGVTRLQLNVGNRTSSTKSFPEASPNVEALLRWRPERTGRFELSVIAFRGTIPSAPAFLTLQVLRPDQALSNPASGQPSVAVAQAGECVGRVLIGNLNKRAGPATTFDKLGSFSLNEQVSVLAQNADATWWYVRQLNGAEAWVINDSQWLEVTGTCQGLPVR
jgi:hypothetical protein